MEQSSTSSPPLLSCATPDEIIASLVLLDLRKMMSLSESLLSDFNWGCRRRRSCLKAQTPLTSTSSPPENRIPERKFHIKAEAFAAAQEEKHRTTGSPDTPLCFSPSESDEKSDPSSNKRLRQRDEQKELHTGEIENVKKLKKHNSQLKSNKQEMLIPGRLNLQHYRINPQQLFAADQTAQECQFPFIPISAHPHPSDDGARSANHRAPRGFDLNLPAEEAFDVDSYQPLDLLTDKRAGFAEARRKRIGIIKAKSRKTLFC